MIISGKPEEGLQQHQQEAYKIVTENFKKGENASIVIPPGCGKSFVALQLLADNKDKNILFLVPTLMIKNQIIKYISKYIPIERKNKESNSALVKRTFPNLKITTYQALLRANSEIRKKLKPEIIVMDEAHRAGAYKWGKAVDNLVELNPNVRILGMTATPDRMDDRPVIDRWFDGKVSYQLDLLDAISKNIVKEPQYDICEYYLKDKLDDVLKMAEDAPTEKARQEILAIYEKLRRSLDQAEDIPDLMNNKIQKRNGRYIVFCPNKEEMDKLKLKSKEWLEKVDKNPEVYSIYSEDKLSDIQENIKNFQGSNSEHLKLLYAIDMLDEGVHLDEIDGIIMAKPTNSQIVYLQEIGRY